MPTALYTLVPSPAISFSLLDKARSAMLYRRLDALHKLDLHDGHPPIGWTLNIGVFLGYTQLRSPDIDPLVF